MTASWFIVIVPVLSTHRTSIVAASSAALRRVTSTPRFANSAEPTAMLTGNITVERVAYNPQSDIGSMLSQLTHNEVPDASGGISGVAAAMRLDVRIRSAPAIRFETNLAQALQADADLNLVGTLQQPGLVGPLMAEPLLLEQRERGPLDGEGLCALVDPGAEGLLALAARSETA